MRLFLFLIIFTVSCFAQKKWCNGLVECCGNGMLVQKYRLRVIAENIANVSTHMTDRGEPLQKKIRFVVPDKDGVRAAGIMESDALLGKYLILRMFFPMRMAF